MYEIKTFRITSTNVSIDGLGEWDWDKNGNVQFFSEELGLIEHDLPVMFEQLSYPEALYTTGSKFLIVTKQNIPFVWRFLADTGKIELAATLIGREGRDPALNRAGVAANREGVAFIYESGVIFFNHDGNIRWWRDHKRVDITFSRLYDNEIEYEDFDNSRFIYELSKGERKDLR